MIKSSAIHYFRNPFYSSLHLRYLLTWQPPSSACHQETCGNDTTTSLVQCGHELTSNGKALNSSHVSWRAFGFISRCFPWSMSSHSFCCVGSLVFAGKEYIIIFVVVAVAFVEGCCCCHCCCCSCCFVVSALHSLLDSLRLIAVYPCALSTFVTCGSVNRVLVSCLHLIFPIVVVACVVVVHCFVCWCQKSGSMRLHFT